MASLSLVSKSALLAGLACGILASPALAQGQAAVGQLTCTGKGGTGLIIVSQKSFECRFKPTGKGRTQAYTATVTNIGIDLGATGPSVLVWTVLASTAAIRPGFLSGDYGGVGADASVGVGGGANLLVGGSNKTVSLQPLSGQSQTGLNVAAGIKGLTLRAR
ncbi:MAG: DUF992 domain-containing protein [Hyphomicrobiaceae bacterium]